MRKERKRHPIKTNIFTSLQVASVLWCLSKNSSRKELVDFINLVYLFVHIVREKSVCLD